MLYEVITHACHMHGGENIPISFGVDQNAEVCGDYHGYPPDQNTRGDRNTGGTFGGYAYTSATHNYNENSSGTDVVTSGELSGTAGSVVEGGFINGRQGTYAVGNLNTDAVFEGTIRQFMPTDSTSATSIV